MGSLRGIYGSTARPPLSRHTLEQLATWARHHSDSFLDGHRVPQHTWPKPVDGLVHAGCLSQNGTTKHGAGLPIDISISTSYQNGAHTLLLSTRAVLISAQISETQREKEIVVMIGRLFHVVCQHIALFLMNWSNFMHMQTNDFSITLWPQHVGSLSLLLITVNSVNKWRTNYQLCGPFPVQSEHGTNFDDYEP